MRREDGEGRFVCVREREKVVQEVKKQERDEL